MYNGQFTRHSPDFGDTENPLVRRGAATGTQFACIGSYRVVRRPDPVHYRRSWMPGAGNSRVARPATACKPPYMLWMPSMIFRISFSCRADVGRRIGRDQHRDLRLRNQLAGNWLARPRRGRKPARSARRAACRLPTLTRTLLCRMSIRPQRRTASSIAAARVASRVTSA
jgi:hypothetical protein